MLLGTSTILHVFAQFSLHCDCARLGRQLYMLARRGLCDFYQGLKWGTNCAMKVAALLEGADVVGVPYRSPGSICTIV